MRLIRSLSLLLVTFYAISAHSQNGSLGAGSRAADAAGERLFAADASTYRCTEGYAERWSTLHEQDVVWSKRTWSRLDVGAAANAPLKRTATADLVSTLLEAAIRGEIKAYGDERFTRALPADEIAALKQKAQGATGTLLARAEWIYVYDDRGLLHRTIGLAPAVGGSAEEAALCWFYYPEVRPLLRKESAKGSGVANLDQWFEGCRYSAEITKTVVTRGLLVTR